MWNSEIFLLIKEAIGADSQHTNTAQKGGIFMCPNHFSWDSSDMQIGYCLIASLKFTSLTNLEPCPNHCFPPQGHSAHTTVPDWDSLHHPCEPYSKIKQWRQRLFPHQIQCKNLGVIQWCTETNIVVAVPLAMYMFWSSRHSITSQSQKITATNWWLDTVVLVCVPGPREQQQML